jgi:uncharacterized protein YecE (DUF72 family)
LIEESFTPQERAGALEDAVSVRPVPTLQQLNCRTFIGTAGWNVPSQFAAEFASDGTHLQRYATRLNAVEINSSFYRPHRRETYECWARCVPVHFRFAVKIPKEMTHERRLVDCSAQLGRFASEVRGLGVNLGVLLVQLPPRLVFDAACVNQFLDDLRMRIDAAVGVACEPRHASWFTQAADTLLAAHEIARVAADPPRSQHDGQPAGWRGLAYYCLHGSPQIYYSNYDRSTLERTNRDLAASAMSASAVWCIFDNTAAGAALGNALAMRTLSSASELSGSRA